MIALRCRASRGRKFEVVAERTKGLEIKVLECSRSMYELRNGHGGKTGRKRQRSGTASPSVWNGISRKSQLNIIRPSFLEVEACGILFSIIQVRCFFLSFLTFSIIWLMQGVCCPDNDVQLLCVIMTAGSKCVRDCRPVHMAGLALQNKNSYFLLVVVKSALQSLTPECS
jgi:hypothetical protein